MKFQYNAEKIGEYIAYIGVGLILAGVLTLGAMQIGRDMGLITPNQTSEGNLEKVLTQH